MPGYSRRAASLGSSEGMVFPLAGVTFSGGSMAVKKEATRSWNPLNTDIVQTRAIVAKATPHTEIAEMTLMAWCDFLEKR